MFSLNLTLRFLTLLLFILRGFYWMATAYKADQYKPKIVIRFVFWTRMMRIIYDIPFIVIGIQLLGVKIIPFPHSSAIQIGGFLLVAGGVAISVLARYQLGANWTHAAEYQIKKDHDLITTGIYRYVRHPIYLGLFLSCVGAELVVESYLVFVFLCSLYVAFVQGKKEEALLVKHFGKEYEVYMRKTKMFVPFIF